MCTRFRLRRGEKKGGGTGSGQMPSLLGLLISTTVQLRRGRRGEANLFNHTGTHTHTTLVGTVYSLPLPSSSSSSSSPSAHATQHRGDAAKRMQVDTKSVYLRQGPWGPVLMQCRLVVYRTDQDPPLSLSLSLVVLQNEGSGVNTFSFTRAMCVCVCVCVCVCTMHIFLVTLNHVTPLLLWPSVKELKY